MAFCPVCRGDYPDDWRKCPKDDVILLASNQVGKYRILGVIGSGGMGAVYRAENPDTEAQVAIKLLHPGAAGIESARERFRREAAAVAGLRTRHVVTIHDFGADARGTLFLIMELLEGHSLREEIEAGQPQTRRIALLFEHSLRGLAAAHRSKITHRDLKPENIFVADTYDGEVVKLLDFGIARTDAQDKSVLTGSGALMGTPAYMAPEQIAGNRGDVGPHTDVYAMGVILYEMLTGAAPFVADSVTAVLGRILEREFVPLRELRKDLPKAVHELVEQTMAAEPSARYRDGQALLKAWQRAWETFDAKTRSAEVPPFAGRPRGKGKGVNPLSETDIANAATKNSDALAKTAVAVTTTPRGEVASDGAPSSGKGPMLALAGLGLVIAAGATYALWPGNAAKPVAADAARADAAVVAADATPIDASSIAVPANMVLVRGKEAELGTPTDYSAYATALTPRRTKVKSFFIDRFELHDAKTKLPLRGLTFVQAVDACAKQGKRLPTEAEWELVARSAPIDPQDACLHDNETREPATVGAHAGDCTPSGVCDLLGNVAEWVWDPWRSGDSGADNPNMGTVRGASYAVRWEPGNIHATIHARNRVKRSSSDPEVGARCARDL